MKMNRRISTSLFVTLLTLSLTACGGMGRSGNPSDEELTRGYSEETSEEKEAKFESSDGWSVRYDGSCIQADRVDEHSERFVYTKDPEGTSSVTITYVEGKQPEEAMSEITDQWGDGEAIDRSEDFFPGTEDKWGYWRTLSPKDNSEPVRTLIGGEYNGGVLLFNVSARSGENADDNMEAGDCLADIIDSVEYRKFEDQTMYAYIPGTYEQTTDEEDGGNGKSKETEALTGHITLNKDHTGVMDLGEAADIRWGSIELITPDQKYEYTIEGDYLMVNMGDNWLEFVKAQDE